MNRSNTSPRSYSTDQLRAALGDVGGPAAPDYLPDIVAQAGHIRQRPGWTFLGRWFPMDVAGGRQGVPRAVVLLAVLSVLVAILVSSIVFVGSQTTKTERPLGLPTTPAAWQRVVIDTGAEGGVDVVAAGPRGLLAAVGEGGGSRLYFSTDGRSWTRVAADQRGPIGTNGAALVATDRGFLLVGNEVRASDDGLSWRRIAGPEDDRDLRVGTRIAAAAGGPGFVAVGSDNNAWYSTDGTDWTLADVPLPPGEPSQLERPLDPDQTQGAVEMQGVSVSGRNLIAWGTSVWVHDDNSATFVPVLWASNDGVSWTKVDAPRWDYPKVASGPHGFAVASEDGAVWLSADGRSWERAAEDAFGSSRWPALQNDDGHRVEMLLGSIAAGAAGYIAVGADGVCMLGCPSAETVIWTSPDGRSWSRLPDDDRFRAPTGAGARVAAAWQSDFIVGGEYDGKPAIWISDSEQSGNGANAGTAPGPSIPTPTPGQPVDFTGAWQATDPPPDSSHLTMEVTAMADSSYGVIIRDDYASVCRGATSTMTGVAEALEPGKIVIAQPEYVCDDGSQAQALSGAPLKEQLRNMSFSYDSLRDALYDPAGLEWTRVEVAP